MFGVVLVFSLEGGACFGSKRLEGNDRGLVSLGEAFWNERRAEFVVLMSERVVLGCG